ncbi:MAG: nicotinate-nucleotide adenylyltransferase [Alphaproteobacteria bacterium]
MTPLPSPESVAGKRVGLLGGSFNPAHEGHLHISRLAIEMLRLHEVWWLVSPQNPLKARAEMGSLPARLAGARAIARRPRLRVTAIERALGTRFTIDTLRALKRLYPRTRFVWVMGADNLVQLPAWRDWRAIFRAAPIAVFDRPSYSRKAMTGPAAVAFGRWRIEPCRAGELAERRPPAWVFLDIPLHRASATAIREERARAPGRARRRPLP